MEILPYIRGLESDISNTMFVYVLLGDSEKKLEILEMSVVKQLQLDQKFQDSVPLVRLSVTLKVFSTRIPLDKKKLKQTISSVIK